MLWLSSARVVRCWVKSRNERNPHFSCHHWVGHSERTASDKLEEGGDDVKSSWPLRVGPCCNEATTEARRRQKSLKDTSVRIALATRVHKLELLVIVDQRATVNAFGSCTHRPSHHGSWFYLRQGLKLDHGMAKTGVKSSGSRRGTCVELRMNKKKNLF